MTEARLLSLFLFLLCAPAAGLFFLLGFAGSWACGAAAAAIIVLMIWVCQSSVRAADKVRSDILLFSLAISLALCLLGGEGRLFFANNDWLVRDAIIHDLVSQPWPFVYHIDTAGVGDRTFIMRAPLAMYILPAAIGKICGIYAAHIALLGQNTILFAVIFYFLVPAHRPFRHAAAIIAIFVVFSGLDAVPVLARHALSIDVPSDGVTPADHLETWAGLFQYSSHITQLFWVPQHAIPGWAFVGLYLLWQRGHVGAILLVCVLPYLGYWSPFAAMGAAPFVFYAAASDLIGRKIGRFDVIAVLLAALPAALVGIYLVQGSGTVEHGFLLDVPGFWSIYFPFICIEFIPYVALIVAMRPAAIKDPGFLLVIISLLLIPFYKLGASNDFAMRVSIPALALLAANFSLTLVDTIVAGDRHVWTRFATLILIIGGITGAMEVRRALMRSPLPISECDFVQAWGQSPFSWIPMTSYLVNLDTMPGWMRPRSPVDVPPSAIKRCFAQ
jgi:hypothetical protein